MFTLRGFVFLSLFGEVFEIVGFELRETTIRADFSSSLIARLTFDSISLVSLGVVYAAFMVFFKCDVLRRASGKAVQASNKNDPLIAVANIAI